MRAFKVMAMCRSGHHAIMSWIKAGHGGVEYNNVNRYGISIEDNGGVLLKRILEDGGKPVVFNIEDCTIEAAKDSLHKFQEYDVTPIIVVRDPLNWIASRLAISRKNCKWMANWEICCPRMEDYLRQASGKIDMFGGECISIKYDTWVKDEEYRKEIAQLLEMEDLGVGAGLGCMRMSSFDLCRSTPNPDSITNRWKKMVDDAEFRNIIKGRHDLMSLGNEMFGGEGYEIFKP